ncbi:hypothetical protein OROGR_003501 [Orobanche gracilis]
MESGFVEEDISNGFVDMDNDNDNDNEDTENDNDNEDIVVIDVGKKI